MTTRAKIGGKTRLLKERGPRKQEAELLIVLS